MMEAAAAAMTSTNGQRKPRPSSWTMADTNSTPPSGARAPSPSRDKAESGPGVGQTSIFANISVFTGTYSISALLTSTLTSYVNSQVTTLERHFGFSSTETGLIMAANDIGFLTVVLFVSSLAHKVHIPRALGIMTIMFGVSGIVCAIPHFMFGASDAVSDGVLQSNVSGVSPSAVYGDLCDGANLTAVRCAGGAVMPDSSRVAEGGGGHGAGSKARVALVIIVIGMVLQGVAKTPRFAFVTTYVDASVEKNKTGFFLGIISAVGLMGPAFAFALGGLFTRIYVTLEDTDLHYRHPRWIGAWWLGYVTFGSAACLLALPLFCFPRHMKPAPGNAGVDRPAGTGHWGGAVLKFGKEFLCSLLRVLGNPAYVLAVLASCSVLFAVAGTQSFSAKYVEIQFSFPAWKANIAIAAMLLCMASLGTVIGGYLSRRYRMGAVACLKFGAAVLTVSSVCTALLIAFSCPRPAILHTPGQRASTESVVSGCHSNCNCDDNAYFPVCGEDGKTFFSPCHAGCQHMAGTSYTNCTCISGGGRAVAGLCDYSCGMFLPFMICLCLASISGTLMIVPKLIIFIRAVETRDKPLALGFASFMTSVIGWLLGPICYGKLIDDICIRWEHTCTGTGACVLYDNDSLRFQLFGYQAGFRFLGAVFLLLVLLIHKVTGKFKDEESDDTNGDVVVSLMTGVVVKDSNKDALPKA